MIKYLAANMKMNLLIILSIALFHSCISKKVLPKTIFPQVENQIEGELDFTNGGFELVQWPKNGDEMTLGSIDKTGAIHFSLPDYDIKELGNNHMGSDLGSQFNMNYCKGKGEYGTMGQPLFKTPFDDVYSQLYPPIYVRKYGVTIAYISPVSDERMLDKNNWDKIVGSKYYWMYIDRDLHYKDTCIRESRKGAGLEVERSADIQFQKGWNFIKADLLSVQTYGKNNEQILAKNFLYTMGSSKSEDIKWIMQRSKTDEEILAAKKEFESFN